LSKPNRLGKLNLTLSRISSKNTNTNTSSKTNGASIGCGSSKQCNKQSTNNSSDVRKCCQKIFKKLGRQSNSSKNNVFNDRFEVGTLDGTNSNESELDDEEDGMTDYSSFLMKNMRPFATDVDSDDSEDDFYLYSNINNSNYRQYRRKKSTTKRAHSLNLTRSHSFSMGDKNANVLLLNGARVAELDNNTYKPMINRTGEPYRDNNFDHG
jgi:hypothetical protein